MYYLLMAIAANISIIFIMKHSEERQGNRYAVTMVNYITGVLISYLLMKEKILFDLSASGCFALGLALFNAVCMTGCMLFIQYSISKNGAPLTTTFNRLGILIPTVLSMFLFHELPTLVKMSGVAAAVFAIIYINGGRKEEKNSTAPMILIAIFVLGGLIDFNSKIYGIYGSSQLRDYFILYTFIFCTIISTIVLLSINRTVKKPDIIKGVLVGVPNQLVLYGMVRAAAVLPAYLAFPIGSSAIIFGVNIINFLVFKEKPTKREVIATLIIAGALILLNL